MILYDTRLEGGLPVLIRERSLNSSVKTVTRPEHADTLFRESLQLHKRTEEYIYMLALNLSGRVLGIFEISHGTVSSALLSPREIYQKLLLIGATSCILAHNHPSGRLTPSEDVVLSTRRINQAGEHRGMELLEHLILSEEGYVLVDMRE